VHYRCRAMPRPWPTKDGQGMGLQSAVSHLQSRLEDEGIMRRITVVAGECYGSLEILREIAPAAGKRRVLCRCDCGRRVEVRLAHLRSGHTTSCGECGIEFRGKRRTIRGWAAWAGIPESTLRARLKRGMGLGEALEGG
jgi:hypothetical protein